MGMPRPVVLCVIVASMTARSSTRIQTDFDRTMSRVLRSFPPDLQMPLALARQVPLFALFARKAFSD
jgi:hypothetical protein